MLTDYAGLFLSPHWSIQQKFQEYLEGMQEEFLGWHNFHDSADRQRGDQETALFQRTPTK